MSSASWQDTRLIYKNNRINCLKFKLNFNFFSINSLRKRCFFKLRDFLSILNFLSDFYSESLMNCVKCFFCISWYNCFCFFNLLIWRITLTDFQILNQPCTLSKHCFNVQPTNFWCYNFIQFNVFPPRQICPLSPFLFNIVWRPSQSNNARKSTRFPYWKGRGNKLPIIQRWLKKIW